MSAALPDLLTAPTGCGAAVLPDLVAYRDVVRLAVVATETAPASDDAPGIVYSGAADVHLDPRSLEGSAAGDAERAANAAVYLEDAPRDGYVPDGAVFVWALDRFGRDPEAGGVVVGTRSDGALLVHIR